MDNFVASYKDCKDISCISHSGMFGAICVTAAKGDIETDCREVLSGNGIGSKCRNYKLNEEGCNVLYKFYGAICDGNR